MQDGSNDLEKTVLLLGVMAANQAMLKQVLINQAMIKAEVDLIKDQILINEPQHYKDAVADIYQKLANSYTEIFENYVNEEKVKILNAIKNEFLKTF